MPQRSALRLALFSSSSSMDSPLWNLLCCRPCLLPPRGHLSPSPLFFHPHQEGNLQNRSSHHLPLSSGCSSCIVPVEKAPLLWLPSSLPLLLPPSRHYSPVCADTTTNNGYGFVLALLIIILDPLLTVLSYALILGHVLRIASQVERLRALSNCLSHILAVLVLYIPMVGEF